MKWYQKEVTWGFLIKFMIAFNMVILAFCFRVCSVSTTKDEETLNYINELEQTIEKEREYRDVLWDYVNYLKEN